MLGLMLKWACIGVFVLGGFSALAQGESLMRWWSHLAYNVDVSDRFRVEGAVLYRPISGGVTDRVILEAEAFKQVKKWTYSAEVRYYFFSNGEGLWTNDQRARLRVNAQFSERFGNLNGKTRVGFQHRRGVVGLGGTQSDFRLRQLVNAGPWTYKAEYLSEPNKDFTQRLRLGMHRTWAYGSIAQSEQKRPPAMRRPSKVRLGYFYEHNLNNTGFNFHTLTTRVRW